MKSKKFLILTAIVILSVTCLLAFAGCSKSLDTADAIADLMKAIEASKNSDTYYTGYNDKTSNYTYRLNVVSANDEENMTMQFSVEKDSNLSVTYTHLYYNKGVLLYSNPEYSAAKKGEEKKRNNYEYFSKPLSKEALLTEGFTIKEKVDGNVVDVEYELQGYTDDAMFALLSDLTVENTEVLSYTKNNIVRVIELKVNKEGHFLSKFTKGVSIRLINEKVYQIADLEEKFVFDITYVGPKIFMPSDENFIAE